MSVPEIKDLIVLLDYLFCSIAQNKYSAYYSSIILNAYYVH